MRSRMVCLLVVGLVSAAPAGAVSGDLLAGMSPIEKACFQDAEKNSQEARQAGANVDFFENIKGLVGDKPAQAAEVRPFAVELEDAPYDDATAGQYPFFDALESEAGQSSSNSGTGGGGFGESSGQGNGGAGSRSSSGANAGS